MVEGVKKETPSVMLASLPCHLPRGGRSRTYCPVSRVPLVVRNTVNLPLEGGGPRSGGRSKEEQSQHRASFSMAKYTKKKTKYCINCHFHKIIGEKCNNLSEICKTNAEENDKLWVRKERGMSVRNGRFMKRADHNSNGRGSFIYFRIHIKEEGKSKNICVPHLTVPRKKTKAKGETLP